MEDGTQERHIENRDCCIYMMTPGENNIREFLTSVFEEADDEEVESFKQWIKNEKLTNVATFQLPLNEYMYELDKLRFHHFVSKLQATYLRDLKDWRLTNVLFCWILLRTIIRLFRMLCKVATGAIHRSHYILLLLMIRRKIISTASVTVCYQIIFFIMQVLFMFFVYHMLQSSKILLPQRSHFHYFNDGASSQYKNFENLINLIHHQDDHQLSAV